MLTLKNGSWPSPGRRLGLENDLDAVIFLVDERLVTVRRLVELQRVRNDEARVDLAFLDALEERLHVALHVGLAGSHRERAVHERPHRELVDEAAVDADHRDNAAVL